MNMYCIFPKNHYMCYVTFRASFALADVHMRKTLGYFSLQESVQSPTFAISHGARGYRFQSGPEAGPSKFNALPRMGHKTIERVPVNQYEQDGSRSQPVSLALL